MATIQPLSPSLREAELLTTIVCLCRCPKSQMDYGKRQGGMPPLPCILP